MTTRPPLHWLVCVLLWSPFIHSFTLSQCSSSVFGSLQKKFIYLLNLFLKIEMWDAFIFYVSPFCLNIYNYIFFYLFINLCIHLFIYLWEFWKLKCLTVNSGFYSFPKLWSDAHDESHLCLLNLWITRNHQKHGFKSPLSFRFYLQTVIWTQ